jgi:NAD(P)-dependent dehydrogenase (short-subunit alcohol dehydrogenase family)
MGGTEPVTGDVSRGDDAERIVRAAVGRFGRIDVLANVAGIGDRFLPVVDSSRVRQQEGERWVALASYAVSRATRPTAKQAMRQVARGGTRAIPLEQLRGIAVPLRCCGAAATGCCPSRSPRRPASRSAGRCT